jgi:hypothetical protein
MQLSGHQPNNSLNTDPIPSPASIGAVKDTSGSLGSNVVPAESTLSMASNTPLANILVSETDPVFRAWNKSTGIIITQSQISPAISITQSQISDGGTIVNDADLVDYVPYTGATGDTDLGSNYIIAGGSHIDSAPAAPPVTPGVTIVYDLLGAGTGGAIFSYDFTTSTAKALAIIASTIDMDSDITMSGNNITGAGTIEADVVTVNHAPVNPTDAVNLSYIAGIIAGDIAGLVPYTGATGNLNMGAFTITVPSIIISNAPINGTDGVNKTYADAITTAQALLVPYTGATSDVNLGVRDLAATDVTATGVIKSAGSRRAVVIKTAAYTATVNDEVIICNSAVDFAITLPAASGTGQVLYIKNINVNLVTLTPNGVDTIDAETVQTIRDGDCINIIDYANNKWAII